MYATDSVGFDGAIRNAALGSAARDLSCPPQDLRVILDPLSDLYSGRGVYIIEGCAARVTYMMVIRDQKSSWVLIGKLPVGGPEALR